VENAIDAGALRSDVTRLSEPGQVREASGKHGRDEATSNLRSQSTSSCQNRGLGLPREDSGLIIGSMPRPMIMLLVFLVTVPMVAPGARHAKSLSSGAAQPGHTSKCGASRPGAICA
jgi:hypothetical protein